MRRYHARFTYHAPGWTKSRRVVAKVERPPCELYPRAGFILTDLSRRLVEGAIQEISVESCKGVSLVSAHDRRVLLVRRIIHLQLALIAGPLLLMMRTLEKKWTKAALAQGDGN